MSEAAMLTEATARLFDEHLGEDAVRRARGGEWLGDAWAAIEEMGLPLALLSEEAGGFGIDPVDALGLVRLAGAQVAPLPIGETMAANRALAAAGLPLADGPAGLIPAGALAIEGGRITGSAPRVAWGRHVRTLVAEVSVDGVAQIVRLGSGWEVAATSANVAQEPRDTLAIDAGANAIAPLAGASLLGVGAAVRALQIAGALDRVLDLTIAHVNERVQFGRALAKFQAVQHELAKVAGEVAAAGVAADLAADALTGPADGALIGIAAARVRGGEAASVATAIAQQLHGAIGFTVEHRLHLYTTALWAWRDEYGSQRHWTQLLGEAALAVGPDGFWPKLIAA